MAGARPPGGQNLSMVDGHLVILSPDGELSIEEFDDLTGSERHEIIKSYELQQELFGEEAAE